MPMHNPPHPGGILKTIVFPHSKMTITELAEKTGYSRKTLSSFINGHSRITAKLALKLELEFKTPTAEMWMKMQTAYDLFQARHELEVGEAA